MLVKSSHCFALNCLYYSMMIMLPIDTTCNCDIILIVQCKMQTNVVMTSHMYLILIRCYMTFLSCDITFTTQYTLNWFCCDITNAHHMILTCCCQSITCPPILIELMPFWTRTFVRSYSVFTCASAPTSVVNTLFNICKHVTKIMKCIEKCMLC